MKTTSAGRFDAPQKCKILHVLNHIDLGGTELYVADLSRRLDGAQFESHIAYAQDGALLTQLGRDVIKFKYSEHKASFRNADSLVVPLRLLKYIRAQKIDIVQTYLPPSSAWGWVASAFSAAICTHLIVESLTIGQTFSSFLVKHRWLSNLFDRMINSYGTMLPYSAHEYISLLGLRSNKFTYLGHGVDLDKYNINAGYAAQIREEFHIPPGTVVLGSVGRLAREKEIDFFLRLIPSIKQGFPDFTFLVVGDGPELASLKRLSDQLGISGSVIFAGPRYDTERIFNAIDCHIFCMRRPLLGMANMQAMACGTPLVVYARSNEDYEMASSFVEHGKSGYIARNETEYLQAVLELLRNRQKAAAMGVNARNLAEMRFDLAKHVSRVESHYSALMAIEGPARKLRP